MDIKKMLEDGTKLKWKEIRYLQSPKFPYFIYIDDTYSRGSDEENNIIEHNLTLEYYDEIINVEIENSIESFLNNNFQYTKNREWLSEEKMYMIIYELDTFLEKIVKGE